MRLSFFTIPALDSSSAEQELDGFLTSHRTLSIDREFCSDGPASFWSICVTWLDGPSQSPSPTKGRIDYREVLDEKQFAMYAKLRKLRKELADQEGVPSYALFTNEHLADMVRQRISSKTALQKLHGVGQSRAEKYGDQFLSLLREMEPESKEESGGEDDQSERNMS
jgi:superfamily II DNA helicase RecQ